MLCCLISNAIFSSIVQDRVEGMATAHQVREHRLSYYFLLSVTSNFRVQLNNYYKHPAIPPGKAPMTTLSLFD